MMKLVGNLCLLGAINPDIIESIFKFAYTLSDDEKRERNCQHINSDGKPYDNLLRFNLPPSASHASSS